MINYTRFWQKFNKDNLSDRYHAFLWSLCGSILLMLNMSIFNNPYLGFLSFLLYITPLLRHFANILNKKEGGHFYGATFLLSIYIILGTALYYLSGANQITAIIMLVLPLYTFIIQPKEKFSFEFFAKKSEMTNKNLLFIYLFAGIEAILLGVMFAGQTTSLMPSPWMAVKPLFFVFYCIATGILFCLTANISHLPTKLFLNSLHLFTTFAVTGILYPLGWGFDAFVHRATETWILNNGFIAPKQPYYIGQYSLVVWLSRLTNISLFFIDVYLVPILSSLLLPAGVFYSLKNLKISEKYAPLFVWFIPFVPFLSLNLTTPHNLVLLLGMIIVFVASSVLNDKKLSFVLLITSLAAIATHPLLGAPLFIFSLGVIIAKKYELNKKIVLLIFVSIFVLLLASLPLMFVLNNLRAGAGWPEFSNPFARLNDFFQLFARPYWYAKNTPFIFEALYFWQLLIAPIVIVLGITGYVLYNRNQKNNLFVIFPLSAAGFIFSAWLLRSWITFPDVVSYEQGDFPLRLVKAAILFALPFAAYTIYIVLEQLKNKKVLLCGILISSSVAMMLSFYLSYPQRNIKARFPGLNITASDFKAVEWIHNQHEQYDYIVLSNQLVSAAALTNYSFAKYFNTPHGQIFYYSVPTGGLLYGQYGKMLYEGQKREYMTDAMNIAGTDKAYFVLNSYWANADKIAENAKKTADSWLSLDDGKVTIFEYHR